MKILHLITGLDTGGAQMMLAKLIRGLPEHEHLVVSLGNWRGGHVHQQLNEMQVRVLFLDLNRGLGCLPSVMRFIWTAISFRPNAVIAWMYHAMLFSILTKLFIPFFPVYWNIRHSLHDVKRETVGIQLILKCCCFFSRLPRGIVYNSNTARVQHESYGYFGVRSRVIPNSFEEVNLPEEQYFYYRDQLLHPGTTSLIVHVARYHPMKGHMILLKALKRIQQNRTDFSVALVGPGVTLENSELKSGIEKLGLKHITLLGERKDACSIVAAADVAVSPSLWGEAFSNAIGEAMVAGVRCVATDVGDSRLLVGDSGIVVPPNDPDALAAGIEELLGEDSTTRESRVQIARNRIQDNYSRTAVSDAYRELLD